MASGGMCCRFSPAGWLSWSLLYQECCHWPIKVQQASRLAEAYWPAPFFSALLDWWVPLRFRLKQVCLWPNTYHCSYDEIKIFQVAFAYTASSACLARSSKRFLIGGGGGGAGGAEAPLNENLGGLSPPMFRSRKYRQRDRKLVWQNILVSDRLQMVALGEVLFSRTLRTAPSRFQRTFGRAAKVLLWNWYRLWPAWTPALPRIWRSEKYASWSMSGYKYKNHLRSFQQNSCHQNATRRGPQTATIVFDFYTGCLENPNSEWRITNSEQRTVANSK